MLLQGMHRWIFHRHVELYSQMFCLAFGLTRIGALRRRDAVQCVQAAVMGLDVTWIEDQSETVADPLGEYQRMAFSDF